MVLAAGSACAGAAGAASPSSGTPELADAAAGRMLRCESWLHWREYGRAMHAAAESNGGGMRLAAWPLSGCGCIVSIIAVLRIRQNQQCVVMRGGDQFFAGGCWSSCRNRCLTHPPPHHKSVPRTSSRPQPIHAGGCVGSAAHGYLGNARSPIPPAARHRPALPPVAQRPQTHVPIADRSSWSGRHGGAAGRRHRARRGAARSGQGRLRARQVGAELECCNPWLGKLG